MLNRQFWSNAINKQQKQGNYMNLQTDPLDNHLTTSQIQKGLEITIQPYPNGQFRCIDNSEHQFDDVLIRAQPHTWSESL